MCFLRMCSALNEIEKNRNFHEKFQYLIFVNETTNLVDIIWNLIAFKAHRYMLSYEISKKAISTSKKWSVRKHYIYTNIVFTFHCNGAPNRKTI